MKQCEDLILIDQPEEVLPVLGPVIHVLKFAQLVKDGLLNKDDALAWAVDGPASPWVPVGERLPGPDFIGGVMFTTIPPEEVHFGEWCDPIDYGDVEAGFYCRHESCSRRYRADEVSHWAPEPRLPDPPEEQP